MARNIGSLLKITVLVTAAGRVFALSSLVDVSNAPISAEIRPNAFMRCFQTKMSLKESGTRLNRRNMIGIGAFTLFPVVQGILPYECDASYISGSVSWPPFAPTIPDNTKQTFRSDTTQTSKTEKVSDLQLEDGKRVVEEGNCTYS